MKPRATLGYIFGNVIRMTVLSIAMMGAISAETPVQPTPSAPTAPATPPATAAAASPATNGAPKDIKVVEINSAAKVVFVEGEVTILGTNGKRRPAQVGDTIFEGDSLITAANGELHLDMEDGGYMSVRPNTKMRIAKYQAKGDENDTSVIGLLQGSFRAVSGWIGKFNQQKYVIRTPNATIGIRGTDHEPLVIPKGASNAEGEPGTYDKVNIGGSTIRTAQGNADVNPNQSGFVGHDGKAPRALGEVPKFFRATRNEQLIEGKHAAIQQKIMERREQRRAEIKQKLGTLQQNRADNKAQRQQQRQQKQAERKAAAEKKQGEIKAKQEKKAEARPHAKMHAGK